MIEITDPDQFDHLFKTNEDYYDYLTANIESNCPKCGGTDLRTMKNRREKRCARCRTHVSPTAHTELRGTKNHKAWAIVIWYTTGKRAESSEQIAKRHSLNRSTVWSIAQKVRQTLGEMLGEDGVVHSIRNAVLRALLTKRSLETPAFEHPEVILSQKEDVIEPQEEWTNELVSFVGSFQNFIKTKFKGVSRKYVQLYLTQFCCMQAPERFTFGRVVECLSRSESLNVGDILSYISPDPARLVMV